MTHEKAAVYMSKANDRQYETARQATEEVNTPSTSAKESNETDIQFKGDKSTFLEGTAAND